MSQFVGSSATGSNGTFMATNGGAPTALTPVTYTAVGDLILWFHYSRATGGDETVTPPTGFTPIFNSLDAGFGLIACAYKWRASGDTTYTASVTNHTASNSGETILELLETWSDVDPVDPVAGVSTATSTWASSLNLGPISAAGLPAVQPGGTLIVLGGRFENITGQTLLTGDGLTWQSSQSYQLVEASTNLGSDAGFVIQYAVNNTTSPITVTDKTITTTGTAQAGCGRMIVLNPPETGVVGGVYPEANNKLGPFKDGNGNLYTVMERTAGDPRVTMRKSADGGDRWLLMDDPGRPADVDLESFWMMQSGTKLYCLQMRSGTNTVRLHTFATSDDATAPDTWVATDEVIHTFTTAPGDQTCSLCIRSNGDMYAFYRTDPVGGLQRCAYRKKPSGGAWSAQVLIDETASTNFTQVQAIIGANDLIHIFYKNDTTQRIWYKTLSTGDVLSSSTILGTGTTTDDQTMGTPAVYVDAGGTERVIACWKRASDGFLVGVPIEGGTPGSEEAISNAIVYEDPPLVSSFQTVATLAADDATDKIYCLWSDDATHDLQLAVRNGTWGNRVEVLDGRDVQIIVANVFTHSAGNGGQKVLGIVYDDVQGLGRGKPRYTEHSLSTGGSGTASGTHDWTGAAVGSKVSSGTATGSYTYTGTAAGSKVTSGTASGTHDWTGTASGTTPLLNMDGSASGTHDWSGAAVGSRVSSGTAAGAYTYTGTASGARTSAGTASGTYAYAGTATGQATHRGDAAGTHDWTGTATGSTQKSGTASGTHDWTGTASGTTPLIQQDGSATGSFNFSGAASGSRASLGTAAGSYVFTGAASGSRASSGAAVGVYTYVGTAAGTKLVSGTASGTHTWTGTAVGAPTIPYIAARDPRSTSLAVESTALSLTTPSTAETLED